MTVYVDDMHLYPIGNYRGMKMSHMIADSDEELHEMAQKIGIDKKWWQKPPKHQSHYDIAMAKREQAIALGGIPITMRQCSAMCRRRRVTGSLGLPDDAIEWMRNQLNVSTDKESPGNKTNSVEKQISLGF